MESDDEFVSASEGEDDAIESSKASPPSPPSTKPTSMSPPKALKREPTPPPSPEPEKKIEVAKAQEKAVSSAAEPSQEPAKPETVESETTSNVKEEPATSSAESSDEDGSAHSKSSSSGNRSLTAESKQLLAEVIKEVEEEKQPVKEPVQTAARESETEPEPQRKESEQQREGWDKFEPEEEPETSSDWGKEWGDDTEWSIVTPAKTESPEKPTTAAPDKPAGQQKAPAATSAGIWGWGGLVSAVGETFTSAIETGLGLPSGEEMARRQAEAKKKAEEEQGGDVKKEHEGEEAADQTTAASSSGGFGLFSGLVTGGIDVLEKIGQKTFETITVREPNKGGRRRFIFEDEKGQDLSSVLRELRTQAENEEKQPGGSSSAVPTPAQISFATEFGRGEGIAYLEALELLAHSRPAPNQKFRRECVAQLTGVDTEAAAEDASSDFESKLAEILRHLALPYKAEPLRAADSKITKAVEDLDFSTPLDEVFEQAVRALVEFTAQSIQTISKLANLQLTMGGARGSNWSTFVDFYTLLAGRATHHVNQYAQQLSFAADDEERKGDELSTQLLMEATTAVDFLRQAHILLIPIVA